MELPSLPPLPTQRRIAGILSAYDDLIENNTKRIKILEEMARALYREWFVHFRFPGHEKVKLVDSPLGQIPEGWEYRGLGECAKFLSGGTPRKSRAEFWDGDIPWVSSGELTRMRIHDAKLKITGEALKAGSRLAPKDAILAVVRGMSLKKEFRIGMAGRPVAFNQDLKALVCTPGIDPYVLFHALDSMRDEIRQRSGAASHGTGKLDTKVLAEVSIPVPDVATRSAFSAFAARAHALWDVLFRQREVLRESRDLLLPRLISGEIDVDRLDLPENT